MQIIELPAEDDAPLSALVFKIVTDPYVGRLAYFRVYSGVLSQGQTVQNTTKGKKERIGRLIRMHADHREDVTEVRAGDIGAVLGFKESFTGDTLCDTKMLILESITFPEPVISIAIEPKSSADQEKMGEALRKLSEEDPTFRVSSDENYRADHYLVGWVNFISIFLSIACCVNFKCRRMWALHALPIANRLPGRSRKSITSTPNSPVVMVNMVMWSFPWNPVIVAVVLSLKTRLWAAPFPRNTFHRLKKVFREAAESGVLAGYPVVDYESYSVRWFFP